MTNHVHGAPDNQAENLDDILGRGKGDFDMPSGQRWIGVDPPKVEHHMDYETIASGRGYPWEENIDYDAGLDEDQEDGHAVE